MFNIKVIMLLLAVQSIATVSGKFSIGHLGPVKSIEWPVDYITTDLRSDVEEKLDKNLIDYEPLHYRQQTVAGDCYYVQVKITDEDETVSYIHVRIYCPIREACELANIRTDVTEDTAIVYFDKNSYDPDYVKPSDRRKMKSRSHRYD